MATKFTKTGIGSVPNIQDINYFGLMGVIIPGVFLKLTTPRGFKPRQESLDYLADQILQGKDFAIPFLKVEVPNKEWERGIFTTKAKVIEHDGRHRIISYTNVSKGKVPVAIIIKGFRRRHITRDMIKALQNQLVGQYTKEIILNPVQKLK